MSTSKINFELLKVIWHYSFHQPRSPKYNVYHKLTTFFNLIITLDLDYIIKLKYSKLSVLLSLKTTATLRTKYLSEGCSITVTHIVNVYI